MMWTWLACIAGAYVLGSIPFGVFIGKAHGINIREKGSKNIGATNVGRVLGRRWGLLCFGASSGSRLQLDKRIAARHSD